MRKGFVTTLLSVILAFVCVFSFAACDLKSDDDTADGLDEGMPVGEQVTEEEWKAALAEPITNCTVNSETAEYCEIIKGTYYYDSESMYLHEIHICDDEEWFELPEGEIMLDAGYYYAVKGNVIWHSTRDEYNNGDDNWHASKREFDNTEEAVEYFDHYCGVGYGHIVHSFLSSANSKDKIKLADAYSLFTFADGVYSAKLFANCGYYDYDDDDDGVYIVECAVRLSFREGKLVGLSMFVDDYFFNGNVHYVLDFICNNIGKTTVPAPQGAIEAIKEEESK